MEIVITAIWIGTVIISIILANCIDNLKSTVNKQQEQIDELKQQNIELIELCCHMNKASMDIAKKVMSIEERVDNLNTPI